MGFRARGFEIKKQGKGAKTSDLSDKFAPKQNTMQHTLQRVF